MKTPLELVEKVLDMHGLNALAVYDPSERMRLFFAEGAPDELAEHLRAVAQAVTGSMLVKAWRRTPAKQGRRKTADATYSWIVQGQGHAVEPLQGLAVQPAMDNSLLLELAELRAKRDLEQAAQDEREDGQADMMGKLLETITGLLVPKAAPMAETDVPARGSVSGIPTAERGHPSAMTNERMARILAAVKRLHEADPSAFAQYEHALLATYGKAS